MSRYIALIRGINVGKSNVLPMKVLTSYFSEAGCEDVRTYIQSGNVVFSAPAALAPSLPSRIGGHIGRYLQRKVDVSVLLRSQAELTRAIADNPYHAHTNDPKTVHLGFLEAVPVADKVALLDPQQSDTDSFAVLGKHLYLHTPGGLGRSKLTTSFFARLGTPCTMRNWNTVLKLQALLEA